MLHEKYGYDDYGYDYYYNFYYKNISVSIRYVYNSPTWRSDNCQEMRIKYDITKINKDNRHKLKINR